MTTDILELKQPSNYLQTGIQCLNTQLGGGYEAGRTYIYLGISGGFKSGLLLHIALWIKKYNEHLKPKDPTKRLCVLYITQENSRKETLARMFSILTNNDIKNYTPQEAISILRNKGLADEGMNLKILYRPNKSISTDDLYDIIQEIEDEGYEVCALVHDYIKRIRPSTNEKDLRIALGDVVDEFCVLAKTKNIPVISANQMNRSAFSVIENAVNSNKQNISKMLGASYTGESMLVIENADQATIITREFKKSTGKEYLTFNEIKSRGKRTTLQWFAHPFTEGEDAMSLEEDVNEKKSLSLLDLGDDLENRDLTNSKKRISARNRDEEKKSKKSSNKDRYVNEDELDLDDD